MQEAKVFKELVLSDTAKGLVHVFFAQRAMSKVIADTRNTGTCHENSCLSKCTGGIQNCIVPTNFFSNCIQHFFRYKFQDMTL